jgi:hypothetical protein
MGIVSAGQQHGRFAMRRALRSAPILVSLLLALSTAAFADATYVLPTPGVV